MDAGIDIEDASQAVFQDNADDLIEALAIKDSDSAEGEVSEEEI